MPPEPASAETSQPTASAGEALYTPEGQQAHVAAVLAATKSESTDGGGSADESQPEAGKDGAQRGKDGRFAAKEKAADAEAEKAGEKAAKAEKPGTEEPAESPGSLAKFRRLFQEGKVDDACALAGVKAEDFNFSAKAWKEVRAVLRDERATARAEYAKAQKTATTVRDIGGKLLPLIEAVDAYKAGDYDTFFKKATGETIEDFQRKVIAQMHSAGQADPKTSAELAAMRKELDQERNDRKREREQTEAQRAEQRRAEAHTSAMKQISSEIAESDNPAIARLATKSFFVNKVFDIVAKSYDERTKTCMPPSEAAYQVFEEIYGGDEEELPQAGRAANSGPTQRRGKEATNPAPRDRGEGGRKPKTPSHSQAAEAAPIVDDLVAPFGDAESHEARQQRIIERLTRTRMPATN